MKSLEQAIRVGVHEEEAGAEEEEGEGEGAEAEAEAEETDRVLVMEPNEQVKLAEGSIRLRHTRETLMECLLKILLLVKLEKDQLLWLRKVRRGVLPVPFSNVLKSVVTLLPYLLK